MSRSPSRAKPAPVRRQPARVVKPQRRQRPPTFSQKVGAAWESLPLPRRFLKRLGNWILGLLVTAGVVAGIMAMGVPQMVGMATAHAIGRAGFVVRNIEISGRRHVDRDAVYRIVMDARGQDMPLVDLTATRARLLGLGWIADARVSRRLPDTLVVDIVERAPAAILQRDGMLALIDSGGAVLSAVDPHTLPVALPLVIGPGVEGHVPDFQALVASQPALKQLIAGGTWVGQRRWDIRFQSGETLALPEGEQEERAAYAIFARKDAQERLLGRGFVRFDMRTPGQLVVRTSQEPGAKIEDPAPPAPGPVA